MKVDEIITLEDNERFFLAELVEHNGSRYFLAASLDEQDEPTEEMHILEEIQEDDEYSVEKVEDEKLIAHLSSVFTSNILSRPEEIEDNN